MLKKKKKKEDVTAIDCCFSTTHSIAYEGIYNLPGKKHTCKRRKKLNTTVVLLKMSSQNTCFLAVKMCISACKYVWFL